MVLDFDSLSRPKGSSAPTDPFEIFAKTPNLQNAPNDLWKGQAEALARWHKRRTEEDNVILLNTGAGKSIVGVLMAQSLVSESMGPVVFACATIDLIEQTARECERLGLKYTKRAASKPVGRDLSRRDDDPRGAHAGVLGQNRRFAGTDCDRQVDAPERARGARGMAARRLLWIPSEANPEIVEGRLTADEASGRSKSLRCLHATPLTTRMRA